MTVKFLKAGSVKVKVLRGVNKILICTFQVYYPICMALDTRDLQVCSSACVGTVKIVTGTVNIGTATVKTGRATVKIGASTVKIGTGVVKIGTVAVKIGAGAVKIKVP